MTNDFSARVQRVQQAIIWISFILPAALVVVFIAGRWPEYWKWIASEDTPMTSLEVAIMYTTVLACWLAAAFHYLRGDASLVRRWMVLGAGFLWLTMDDRFAIHERLRDKILAPLDISIPFLPMGPGDFIVPLYMVAGLALLPWLKPLFAGKRRAMLHFGLGVAVAAVAVLMDTADFRQFTVKELRLEQSIEECLELLAQILFLQGIIVALLDDVRALGR